MLKVGQFLGDRYEILAQIGVGGMAEVYRAKCHKLNRMVAIKVLKDEFNDKNFVSKFKAEAQAAAGLSHPNIVSIYDVGDEEDIHYIVMELVEGITLKQYISKKKKLDIKEAIGITIQVAQGIGAAHEQHIIHRDIKPQNVIISRDGKVKVTDFGIAKVASSNTIDSKAVGSVYYFSPEQARGGYCDERSDIYSLGITLFEMLTGQVPFVGESTVAVALAHLQMDMTPPREIDPMIPVSLEKIILKATQKKPERRYSTAGELIADLRKALLMPDEDFVKIMPTENTSPTLLIGEDEITAIKQNKTVMVVDDDPEPETPEETEKKVVKTKKYRDDDEEDDDDGEEKVRSVWDKVIFGFIVLVCIAILCVAGFMLSTVLKSIKSSDDTVTTTEKTEEETTLSSKEVKMPMVEGMVYEDAAKLLKNEYNLGVIRVEVASEIVKEGYVISQQYPEGTVLDKNISVELTVSSGSGMVTLPDEKKIVGVSIKNVKRDLKALGLVIKEETEYSEDVEVDKVTRIDPEPGSKVEPGSEVTVYISLGEEVQYVYVPELKGYTLDEAEDILDMKLIIGEITEEFSDGTSYAKGEIMEQSLKVNEKVEKGTKIDLIVSKGREFESIPDVDGMKENDAVNALDKLKFVWDKTSEKYDAEIPEGEVIEVIFDKKDLSSDGKRAKIGAKYEIVISKGVESVKVPNLKDKTEAEAIKELEKAELKLGTVTQASSDTVEAGKIIDQSVKAGESVKVGEKIDVTISSGKKTVKIDLIGVLGASFEAASKYLTDQGFTVTRGEDQVTTQVTEGCVVSCNYSHGSEVAYGANVVIIVAKAPETEPEPSVPAETSEQEDNAEQPEV